jgi:hypothetical protein
MSETKEVVPVVAYKHFAPAGDLIACLPGMRQVYRDTGRKAVICQRLNTPIHLYDNAKYVYINSDGLPVAMNETIWNMLMPLLEVQDYVHGCETWAGQTFEINLDIIREQHCTTMPHGSLYHWMQLAIPQMATDFSEQFLTVVPFHEFYATDRYNDKIIINRTERYTNPYITYYFLKEYEDRIIFAGTKQEWEKFCAEWNLKVAYLEVPDFLMLARIIASCKFFIGNQSMCFHIAEGLKKKRLLEVSTGVPNVWPQGKDGFPFYQQANLEYYFKQFIAE